jgi:hypothetical protein
MISEKSTESASHDELKASLEAFETSLETPVISGELTDWLEAVNKTWSEASAQIQDRMRDEHARQFDEMGKEDPELLPRVELLQAEDGAIEADRLALGQLITNTSQQAPKLEPDEGKANDLLKDLIDAGLALVTRVRTQEVAIQTWFFEAFNRDRGPVD